MKCQKQLLPDHCAIGTCLRSADSCLVPLLAEFQSFISLAYILCLCNYLLDKEFNRSEIDVNKAIVLFA
jgi:hypothetical protein